MRHARDGVAAAIDAATRVLSIRGSSDPPEGDNQEVIWGTLLRDGVWAPTRDGQRVHVGIPGSALDRAATIVRPGLRVFPGVDPDVDVMAQTNAAGVRFITVLHGPKAPAEYRFTLRLADGLALEQVPSGGYDVVHERYGATVGRFHAPWASDSLYRRVAAEYRLDGSTLVMTLRHEDAHYPVVADPLYAR